jgi:hypothetical protein
MNRREWGSSVVAASLALAAGAGVRAADAPDETQPQGAEATPPKKLFRGQVVIVREALKRRGLQAFEEMAEQVALETPDGHLLPIIADWRGRAFYQDERLRDRKVELVGYQREGLPYLQVLMVFTFDEDGRRMYTDYWCDICAIPMYEIKPCDCCQAPTRLRFQPQELPEYLNGDVPDGAPPADAK